MPINPVQFAHSVCDEFLRYLFSAFPLSDPELAEQARRLLERPSSLDIPLVKGPFVSLSESFAKGESIQKLASDGILHPVMPGLIGYPTMYLHRARNVCGSIHSRTCATCSRESRRPRPSNLWNYFRTSGSSSIPSRAWPTANRKRHKPRITDAPDALVAENSPPNRPLRRIHDRQTDQVATL